MLKRIGMTGWNANTASLHLLLSVVYHYWNDLEGAASEREKAISSFPIPSVMGSIYLYTTAASLIQGDIGAAAEILKKAESVLITEDATPEDLARVAAFHIVLALEENDQVSVSRWLDKLAEYEGPLLYDAPPRAKYLLYERLGEAGREWLHVEHEQYHKEGYQYPEMEVRLQQALISSDPDEALSFLGEVLVMAQSEGNIRILADFGVRIVPLLRRAIAAGIEPEFARKILRIIKSEDRQRQIRKGEIPTTTSLLSERETEVLLLIADGLTNKQIADELVISLNTVKSHVHHIFDKLDARDRLQVANRARELNLI
jgi:LuxR family maltose regulon positive regulatory protein